MFKSMSAIRAANKAYAKRASRAYWFERGAMKFFNTRIEGGPYGGRFFVTSERMDDHHPIGWAVREAHPDGRISTVGNLQDYSSKASAVAAAKRLAQGGARTNSRANSSRKGKGSKARSRKATKRPNQGRRAARANPRGANKYVYLHVLQGNYGYGHGWEDLTAEESRREILKRLREYRSNEGGNYRIIKRREPRAA